MHSSKGLEFDVVFITDLIDGICPHYKSKGSTKDEHEEKRLLFVAMTRAKSKMYLLSTKTKQMYDQIGINEPTPWLKSLLQKPYIEHEPIPRQLSRKMEDVADLALFMKEYLDSVPKETNERTSNEKSNYPVQFTLSSTLIEDRISLTNNSNSSSSTAPLFTSAANYKQEESDDEFDDLVLEEVSNQDEEEIDIDIPTFVDSSNTSNANSQSQNTSNFDDIVFEDEEIEIEIPTLGFSQSKKRKFE